MAGSVQKSPAALVATLGSEPQVVTAALDLLLQQGEPVNQVTVIHTVAADGTPIDAALQRLKQELQSPFYDSTLTTTFIPLLQDGHPLEDVETQQAARVFFRELYRCIWNLKQQGWRVHLSIAGGRKTMAVFGMAAAQLLFDEHDHLWHLFSSGDFLSSKRLHPQPSDQTHLVSVPVILWSHISPVMHPLQSIDDPDLAIERVRALQLNEKIEIARSFLLGALTPAEFGVVQALVQQGLGDQQIAEALCLSPRTVEQHLRSAYRKAAVHWDLQDVGRTQLVSLLSLYFSTQITGKPA